MEIISNPKQLNSYINQHQIDKLFSFWNKYNVKLIKYEKGETICSKDKPLTHLSFVVKGYLKIYYLSSEGKMLALSFNDGFTMLGDMEFAEKRDVPYAQALSEVHCVSISLEEHGDILNEDILFCRYIIKCLAKKVEFASRKTFVNLMHSTENRLALYLLSCEENGFINENWTDVASLLSSSYRQLMRLLGSFCDNGLLTRGEKKGIYLIVDKDKLHDLSKHIYW